MPSSCQWTLYWNVCHYNLDYTVDHNLLQILSTWLITSSLVRHEVVTFGQL